MRMHITGPVFDRFIEELPEEQQSHAKTIYFLVRTSKRWIVTQLALSFLLGAMLFYTIHLYTEGTVIFLLELVAGLSFTKLVYILTSDFIEKRVKVSVEKIRTLVGSERAAQSAMVNLSEFDYFVSEFTQKHLL